jgi:hypothetical protein
MHRCLALLFAAACAGCGIQPTVVADNYLTYDYAIADQLDAAIARNATEFCNGRKQLAVRTQYTCVGNRCITTYQCMSEGAAREDGLLAPAGK